ncbi:MAG: Mur ligase domain-containing protein, partial [Opitutaceae bacterium]
MPEFAPEDLARWAGGAWTVPPNGRIGAFGIDSRKIRRGEVFVALRTDRRDGRDFVAAAEANGAAGAIVDRQAPGAGLPQLVVAEPLAAFQAIAREHRRRFPGTVIAVTGSAGKTSTKE